MTNQTIEEVWHNVLDFIKANQWNLGAPRVSIQEGIIEVVYRTKGVIREIPSGCERWRIYADDNDIVLCCVWDYDEDSNQPKIENK